MLFLVGILVGVIFPVQTAINSKLRFRVGSPYLAAMVAFIVSSFFLGILTMLQGQSLLIPTMTFVSQPWWIWLGGLLGIVGGTIPIVLFPRLGSVQTVIIPVFGQVIMGMLIDNFGWFASPRFHFSWLRGVGVVALLIGLLMVILVTQVGKRVRRHRDWLWQVLGLVAGMALASQAAVNGKLGTVLHSPIHAAFVSFLTGMVILVLGVTLLERDLQHLSNGFGHGNPWWIWFGGLFGGLYVFGNSFLAPLIGTGATVVIVLLGNILGGLLIDRFGLLGAKRKPVTVIQLFGLILMVIGVSLVKFG